MVKAIYIPSDFNFHPEYERSFHWNLIVLEKSFVLSEETSGKKTESAFWLDFKCTRLWLSAVIVLH